MTAEQNASMQLKDGRMLAYAIYGDPRGRPVFFFHGTPGTRLFRPSDEISARLGVRLICMDRPGYGDSTFQPGRRLLDWPSDIAQLAGHLSIEKFAIAAHSGGGPHALACAFALQERISSVATLSGGGPPEAPGAAEGLVLMNRLGFTLSRYTPWLIWHPLAWLFNRERCADPGKVIDQDSRKGIRPAADERLITTPEIRELCIKTELDAYRHGLLAFAWDARLITRPWGFSLEQIKVPVHLWHGTADNVTSMAMARYMLAKIPNCQPHFCENEGHLLLFTHWEEILASIQ